MTKRVTNVTIAPRVAIETRVVIETRAEVNYKSTGAKIIILATRAQTDN